MTLQEALDGWRKSAEINQEWQEFAGYIAGHKPAIAISDEAWRSWVYSHRPVSMAWEPPAWECPKHGTKGEGGWDWCGGCEAESPPGPLTMEAEGCHAGGDGDCDWPHCPQTKDGEPAKSGRYCPLDTEDEEA